MMSRLRIILAPFALGGALGSNALSACRAEVQPAHAVSGGTDGGSFDVAQSTDSSDPLSSGQLCRRSRAAIWMRLPQVSSSMAMVEPVTLLGGMVNFTPRPLRRSYSDCTSSTKKMAAGWLC
jgi:hypothetical protein